MSPAGLIGTIVLSVLLSVFPCAHAADAPVAEQWAYGTLPQPSGADGKVVTIASTERELQEHYLEDRKEERRFKHNALLILSVTMAVLYLIAAIMLLRKSPEDRGKDLVHLTSLSLIIYAALALALISTTSESLTAPIGILGALAGYLFGQSAPTGKGRTPPPGG